MVIFKLKDVLLWWTYFIVTAFLELDMQESEFFGQTLDRHIFSQVDIDYPSDGSVFRMLLGEAMRKILGLFHSTLERLSKYGYK